jgi:hypothetical protein
MKITRSSKTTIKFATAKKQEILNEILDEYSRVVNFFIRPLSKVGVVYLILLDKT